MTWIKTLGRKKKDKGDTPQLGGKTTKSSGFVFMGSGENEFLQNIPSNWMNPDFEEQPPKGDRPPPMSEVCLYTQASLVILSRSPIRNTAQLLSLLEIWLDGYTGSRFMYPYHTLMYLLLGAKVIQRKSTSSLLEYKAEFQGLVRLGYTPSRGCPECGPFSVRMTEGKGSRFIVIKFDIAFRRSEREGRIYPEYYKMGGFHFPFQDNLSRFHLEVTINQLGLIGPT